MAVKQDIHAVGRADLEKQQSRSDQRESLIYYTFLSWINYHLREIKLSEEEVAAWLSNLDTSNASGPDDIPARLLKQCSQ